MGGSEKWTSPSIQPEPSFGICVVDANWFPPGDLCGLDARVRSTIGPTNWSRIDLGLSNTIVVPLGDGAFEANGTIVNRHNISSIISGLMKMQSRTRLSSPYTRPAKSPYSRMLPDAADPLIRIQCSPVSPDALTETTGTSREALAWLTRPDGSGNELRYLYWRTTQPRKQGNPLLRLAGAC